MKKRFLSLVLLALIAAQTSCGDNTNNNTPSTSDSSDTTVQNETTQSTMANYLPDMDLSGFELRVATFQDSEETFFAAESTGDVVNDAIYKSTQLVYDKYGATIVPVIFGTNSGEVRSYVTKSVTANDNDFDLVRGHDCTMWSLSLEDYFLNVRELEYQDFSQPWYPEYANDAYMVNDKQYIFTSYMSTNSLAWAKVLFMNKTIVENYKLDLPYDSVREGTWTLDKFITMSKSVYEDLDADGSQSDGDLYGFIGYNKLYGFQSAFVSCYNEEDDGTVTLNYNKEKFIDVATKLSQLLNGGEGGYITGDEPDEKYFLNGQAMFFYHNLETLTFEDTRSSDINYGVLPVPKYDEAQENYITPSFDCQFAIPVTVQEPEKVSLLVEAYSSAGYNIIRPAYFDTALSTKYTRDEDSIEMLEIISNTLTVDLAYLNTSAGTSGLGRAFMYVFKNPNTGISSYLDSIESSEKAIIKTINEYFQ